MSDNKPAKVVFIGNIPYGSTEESLRKIFERVGQVAAFRLVSDKDTGKQRGYGFCEYTDIETAKCCVRSLHNYDFNGRQLRVGFAESELGAPKDGSRREGTSKRKKDLDVPEDYHKHQPNPHYDYYPSHGGNFRGNAMRYPQFDHGLIPPHYQMAEPSEVSGYNCLYPPVYPIPQMSSESVVLSTLDSLPPEKLLQIITQTKSLVQNSPELARGFLKGNPQLAFALFQILLKFQLIEPTVIDRILGTANRPIDPRLQVPPIDPRSPPPMQEHQKALLAQIIQLTPQQIDSLPSDQREKVLLLKSQFRENQC